LIIKHLESALDETTQTTDLAQEQQWPLGLFSKV
jgi:hypothetical protein